MADLQDIVINIKPSIDDKQYKKELQSLVDNSKSAMEKAYRGLDKSLQTSLREISPNVKFDNPWEEQIDNFLDKFREVQTYMQSTGFLPEDMNSKLYQAYANVKKIYDMYVAAEKEASKIYQDTATTTTEYAQWKSRVDSISASYTNMESKVGNIRDAIKSVTEVENLKEGLGPGADKMVEGFIKIKDAIAEAEVIYNKLQADVESSKEFWSRPGRINYYDPNLDTTKLTKEQKQQLQEVLNLQNELNKAEADYKGQRMRLNFYSKNRDVLEQIYQLTKQTDFDGTGTRNLEQLGRELESAKQKAELLKAELDKMRGQEPTQYQYHITEEYERATERVRELKNELVAAAQKTQEIDVNAKKTGTSFNQWRNAVWGFSRLLGNFYTIGLDIYRGARRIANVYMRIWSTVRKILSVMRQWRKNLNGTAVDHAKSFKQMLKDIFRYSFGIRSLFMLFRRLRTYIKEAFTEMANQIPEVNAMLASLKSSLYALKGSLATAFEPILSAIAPALVRLIDLLAQAITYIGMFFAALTGRGFVYQAKKVAQTIGDAAGNAKELNKQLQGFDELNNLTTNKGSGGGGDNPLAQFEKVDVPDWIENIAKKVKQLWDDILGPIKDAWAKVGDYVVAAWKRAFQNVKALLRDIVDDFVEAWKSGLGEIIATRFFEIIGDIGNIIANLAEKIREAWNYNNNGLKIWTAILTIVEKILTGVRNITIDIVKWTNTINLTPAMTAFKDWLESLIPIAELFMGILYDIWNDALKPILTWAFDGENSGIALFFKILKKFNDELDKSKLRENLDKIWQAVGRFGKTIGEGLLIFMNKMLGYLKDWLNSDDFTEWCQKVADFLNDIEPADIAETLDQVWRIIKNIAKEVYDVIQFVWDHRQDILDTLEWASTHIKEIAAVFLGGKLLIDVIRFVANIVLFGGAISKAFGAATAAAAGAEAAAGAAAGAAAAGATEVAGATAAAGAAAAETGGIMSGFVGTLAALASVLGSVALGYGIAIPAAKALDPILEENQLKVDDLKASMDDTIPTYDEMSQAAREASRNQKEYAEKMSDMYAQLLKTHPELQNLKDALEENGYKIGNNVDLLEQINDGFKVFNASGGDVQTTLSILAEKYGTVDQKAALFFNNLADGKEKCANVKDAVDKYNSTLEETKKKTEEAKEPNDNLIKVYKSEKEVLEDIQKGHDNVVGSFKTHWDIVNKQTTAVKENTDANRDYNSSNNELVGAMKTLEETLKELSEKFVGIKSSEEEVVDYKTIFGDAMGDMQTAMQDTSDTAAETGDNIVSGIKTPIENAKFDKETQSFFKTLFGDFQTAFDSHSPAKKMYPIGENILMGIVEGFKQKFDEFKKAIQNFYDNTVKPWFDPSKWTFDGVGQGLKETFEKAKNWIKTPINDMLGFMEKLVNGIIDGFNKMGDVLGSIDIDIPDWVPEIGGKSFEFKMPSLNHISIPRLAQGAVIPPNKEFLAVLGDQKSGTNIESPLSTMVEAFNQANKGGSEEEIALLQEQNELLRQLLQKDFSISEREVYRSVINQDSIRRKSTGRSAFAY